MDSKSFLNYNYEQYIISSNQKLQVENKELQKDILNKMNELSKLEEEVERLESSKTYMRGFLNNIILIEKLYIKKNDHHNNIINCYNSYSKLMYKNNRRIFRYIQVCFVLLYAFIFKINYFTNYEYVFLLFLYIGFHIFSSKLIVDIKLPDVSNHDVLISDINKEILELNKGQDFLHEYVEIM
jgi:hypothetical protein